MPPWAVPPVPPVTPSVTHESRPRVCHPEDCAYPSPSSSSSSSVVVVVVVRGRRRPWSPGQRPGASVESVESVDHGRWPPT